jgi:hypothetical protein
MTPSPPSEEGQGDRWKAHAVEETALPEEHYAVTMDEDVIGPVVR